MLAIIKEKRKSKVNFSFTAEHCRNVGPKATDSLSSWRIITFIKPGKLERTKKSNREFLNRRRNYRSWPESIRGGFGTFIYLVLGWSLVEDPVLCVPSFFCIINSRPAFYRRRGFNRINCACCGRKSINRQWLAR